MFSQKEIDDFSSALVHGVAMAMYRAGCTPQQVRRVLVSVFDLSNARAAEIALIPQPYENDDARYLKRVFAMQARTLGQPKQTLGLQHVQTWSWPGGAAMVWSAGSTMWTQVLHHDKLHWLPVPFGTAYQVVVRDGCPEHNKFPYEACAPMPGEP